MESKEFSNYAYVKVLISLNKVTPTYKDARKNKGKKET